MFCMNLYESLDYGQILILDFNISWENYVISDN